jgi:hypothetical protein
MDDSRPFGRGSSCLLRETSHFIMGLSVSMKLHVFSGYQIGRSPV